MNPPQSQSPPPPTAPSDPLSGTYHRRELKPPSIQFSSPAGKQLFRSALNSGYMELYFTLSEVYQTQAHPAFCGLTSLSMCLNALLHDPKRVLNGVWRWYDESFLDCCEKIDVVKVKGVTLVKLNCLALCQGAESRVMFADDIDVEGFRENVKSSCGEFGNGGDEGDGEGKKHVMIVSYSRKALNQTGDGHFSPVGGYNSEEDMVLIMDVARFKHPPHWIPLTVLFEAMKRVDSETGKCRGYMIISKTETLTRSCNHCCRPGSGAGGGADSNGDNVLCNGVTQDANSNANADANANTGANGNVNERKQRQQDTDTALLNNKQKEIVINDKIDALLKHECEVCIRGGSCGRT